MQCRPISKLSASSAGGIPADAYTQSDADRGLQLSANVIEAVGKRIAHGEKG
jgi:hypothetical protein